MKHSGLKVVALALFIALTGCATINVAPPDKISGPLPYHPTASRPQGGGGEDGTNPALRFMCDQVGPTGPNDFRVRHMDFWSRSPNPEEWVQYNFERAMKVSSVSVYWWDDRDNRGGCRVPDSWRLMYKDGDAWKPVQNLEPYGCERNQYNTVKFKPVATKALRIEIKQGTNASGVSEWKVE